MVHQEVYVTSSKEVEQQGKTRRQPERPSPKSLKTNLYFIEKKTVSCKGSHESMTDISISRIQPQTRKTPKQIINPSINLELNFETLKQINLPTPQTNSGGPSTL